jgi:hypothetical protein
MNANDYGCGKMQETEFMFSILNKQYYDSWNSRTNV